MEKKKAKNILWDIAKLIIPAFVGFLFAYITFSKQYDATERARLNDNVNKILDLNMQYPFVINNEFINKWSKAPQSNSDSSIRYQTYCTYTFNLLQDIAEYYKYDKKKIEAYIDVEDLIGQHKKWWSLPDQQAPGAYPEELRKFVDDYFKRTQ